MLRLGTLVLLFLCATCAKQGRHGGADAARDAAVAADTIRGVEDGQGADGRGGSADATGDVADAAEVALAPDTGLDFGLGETLAVDAEQDAPMLDVSHDLGALALADAPIGKDLEVGPACVAYPQPPPDVPSRQAVRFHFVSSAPGYVVTQGTECLPFVIETSGDGGMTALLLDVRGRNNTSCEGAPYLQALPAGAIALSQDGEATLTWDTRQLEPHLLCVDCTAQGWPGTSSGLWTLYTRVPVGPLPRDLCRARLASRQLQGRRWRSQLRCLAWALQRESRTTPQALSLVAYAHRRL
jgi:hypothetical protein